MREAAGLNAREAAQTLGIDHTKISHMETARFGVSPDRIRVLAGCYGCTDTEYIDALIKLATDRKKGWWEDYRGVLPAGFLDLTELENKAKYLYSYQIGHIPGLTQTEEYARAIFDFGAPHRLPKRESEARIAHRIRRAHILTREDAPQVTALIHEAALRMRFGGADVTRRQLVHLLNISELPNCTFRVFTFEAEGFAGSGQSILYASGSVPKLDTVHLDSSHGPVFLDTEAQLTAYRQLLQTMEKRTLSASKSRDFIRKVAQEL